jgi:hypothetical protein
MGRAVVGPLETTGTHLQVTVSGVLSALLDDERAQEVNRGDKDGNAFIRSIVVPFSILTLEHEEV